MKKLLTTLVCLVALAAAGAALATPDWAGNQWPLHGSSQVPTGPVAVYAQVYQAGVTDAAGQGAGISADLYYASSIDGLYHIVPMTFNADVGNNDEYTAEIPQSALLGATWIDTYCIFFDDNDGTWIWIDGDQAGNPPPLRYNVTDVLPVDVTVRFTLCMSGIATTGAPCVIGSATEIGSWGTGVNLTDIGGEQWQVDVVFAAGGNPSLEYKYKKDGCTSWESIGNRLVTLPTDGTSLLELDADGWEGQAVTCDPVSVEGRSWGGLKTLYR